MKQHFNKHSASKKLTKLKELRNSAKRGSYYYIQLEKEIKRLRVNC